MEKKHIIFAVVVVLIIASIVNLQSRKAGQGGPLDDSADLQQSLGKAEEVFDTKIAGVQMPTNKSMAQEKKESEEPTPSSEWQIDTSKIGKYKEGPQLRGIAGYINSEPFNLMEFRGKVVLVDFWTYSCINCQRTFPYLGEWYEKYKDQGLEIVGVHTPEFQFEKDYDNVVRASEKFGVVWRVAQDNDYRTWRAYRNQYWPRKYILDVDGFIRYDHIGEGAYAETEKVIQELLKERADRLNLKEMEFEEVEQEIIIISSFGQSRTPEVYFGAVFRQTGLGNVQNVPLGITRQYTLPEKRSKNKAYIEGSWTQTKDYMELISETGKVILDYTAKELNIVAQSANQPTSIKVVSNGEIPSDDKGIDIDEQGMAVIEESNLYNLIDKDDYDLKTIEIDAEKGFRIFTFTFG